MRHCILKSEKQAQSAPLNVHLKFVLKGNDEILDKHSLINIFSELSTLSFNQ